MGCYPEKMPVDVFDPFEQDSPFQTDILTTKLHCKIWL